MLEEGKHYTVRYEDNDKPGTAKIIITGLSPYEGEIVQTFVIKTETHEVTWKRLQGGSAITTMKAIVNEGWETSDWAIVATNKGYHDALSASGIAGLLGAPVLMTDPNSLSSVTKNLIVNKGIKNVLIVGGTNAVSANVETQIKAISSVSQVIRKSGGTATTTAIAIYKYGKELAAAGGESWSQDAIVATSKSFQDALSIAPYAYAKKAPIFLTDLNKTNVRDSVVSMINSGEFTRSIIVGGTAVVEQATDAKLVSSSRFAGTSCYSTSTEIAKFCLQEGMVATNMGVARGDAYQDALAGAALLGKNNSIIVLADDNKKTSKTYNISRIIAPQTENIYVGYIFGGTGAVSQAVEDTIVQTTGATVK